MSTSAEILALPSRPSRFAFIRGLRLSGFPLIPTVILVGIAFVAVFANQLAPHNPEVGSLAARFKPPFWETGGSMKYLLGTDQLGRDAVAADLRRPRLDGGRASPPSFAGIVGTTLGIISGYLGGWVDQASCA
jgi:peptide/nickel transport system permease protein